MTQLSVRQVSDFDDSNGGPTIARRFPLINPGPKAFAAGSGALIVCLLILSSASVLLAARSDSTFFYVVHKAFWVGTEKNIPTLTSFALYGIAWFTCALAAMVQYASGTGWWKHWVALALLLFFLSFDEAAQVHESLTKPVRIILNTDGIFYYAWIIPGAVFLGIVSIVFLPFVMALPSTVRGLVFLGAAVFALGALATEMVGGALASSSGVDTLAYYVSVSFEEFFEMSGMAIFCTAVIAFLHGGDAAAR